MRPLDLLALKIDEDHKSFIKEYHGEQKNFKIEKQYEVYSWGRSENFNLGYAKITEEIKRPKKVIFSSEDLESIRDIKTSESFTVALSEDG